MRRLTPGGDTLDKITITLYDVVGYVIPGFLCLLSVAIFLVFLTGNPICLTVIYDLNIFWQIGVAYIVGHLIQAVVSILWKNNYDVDLTYRNVSQEVFAKFKQNVSCYIGGSDVGQHDILILENNILDDKISTKVSMFRAFQGLYKGTIGVLGISILEALYLLFFSSSRYFTIKDTTVSAGNASLITVLIVLSGMFLISVIRHNAFIRSRIRTIISYYVGRNV